MARTLRQPTYYLSHGGGPCFWITLPAGLDAAIQQLRKYLSTLLRGLPETPAAILVVSGHWEAEVHAVSSSKRPGMFFDYQGFPEHTYKLNYPAPGSPELARRVQALLQEAGVPSILDAKRGFDHGVFVPFLIVAPDADIPIVMLSMQQDLDASHHIEVGKALTPLRDEGVLIVGSGNSYHNLRSFFRPGDAGSRDFDSWLTDAVIAPTARERNEKLALWENAPSARACHPCADHLIPLMVAAGAAGQDCGKLEAKLLMGDKTVSCYSFGGSEDLPVAPLI